MNAKAATRLLVTYLAGVQLAERHVFSFSTGCKMLCNSTSKFGSSCGRLLRLLPSSPSSALPMPIFDSWNLVYIDLTQGSKVITVALTLVSQNSCRIARCRLTYQRCSYSYNQNVRHTCQLGGFNCCVLAYLTSTIGPWKVPISG